MTKHSKTSQELPASKSGKPRAATPSPAPKPAAKGARGVARPPEDVWTEVANFVLTFERRTGATNGQTERRISAHKMQEGGITANWTGVAQQPMCEWIAQHVGDWANAEHAEPMVTEAGGEPIAAQAPSVDATGLTVAIAQLRALAPADPAPAGSGKQDEGSRTSFHSGEAFNLEALIEICGLPEADAARNPPCSVQFFSRNTVTKERARLGEALIAHRVHGQSSYRAILARVRLPAGSYRLESVAMLSGKQPKLAYGQMPLLQVL